MSKICLNCGHEADDNAKFCIRCGSRFSDKSAEIEKSEAADRAERSDKSETVSYTHLDVYKRQAFTASLSSMRFAAMSTTEMPLSPSASEIAMTSILRIWSEMSSVR